jgi:hypothetical protein
MFQSVLSVDYGSTCAIELIFLVTIFHTLVHACCKGAAIAADRGKLHRHPIIQFPFWMNIFNKHNHSHRHQISNLTVLCSTSCLGNH